MGIRWLSDLAGTLRDFAIKGGKFSVTGAATFGAQLQLTPTSAPVSPANGWFYYDITAKRIETYDGVSWNKYIALVDLQSGGINVTFNTAVIGGSATFSGNFGIANALTPTFQVVYVGNTDVTQTITTAPGASGNTFGNYPITAGARTNSAAGAWGTTAMSSSDILWAIPAIGDAGSGTNGGGQTGGYLQWVCDGAWTNAHYPTRLELYLCSATSTTPALAATFKNNGFLANGGLNFNIAQAFPGSLSNGNAFMYASSTLGLVIYGAGSIDDVIIANKSGSTAIAVPTGTVTPFAPAWGSQYVSDGTVTSTVSLNFVSSNCHSFTLTTATPCTVSVGTPPQLACDITIKVSAPASGTVPTVTWPATFKNMPVTLLSGVGKTTTLRMHYDGTNYLCVGSALSY